MGGPETSTEQVLKLARTAGVLRVRDLTARGIHPEVLRRLLKRGVVIRTGRGLYTLAEVAPTENRTLAEVCKWVPAGVVCLLSALRFHGLTTQAPHEVWLAIPPRAWAPKVTSPEVRLVRFSGAALTGMVEEHEVEGAAVRVYGPAKTVADCFKYRNKIGVDVAVEALRDCWQKRRASADELWRYAKICRVANVMRPYMEAITAA